MQGQEFSLSGYVRKMRSHAANASPGTSHQDESPAHPGFVHQNPGTANNHSDPSLWRVEMMDPWEIGFHDGNRITEPRRQNTLVVTLLSSLAESV